MWSQQCLVNYFLHKINQTLLHDKQVQRHIGPTMGIARGLVIISTIEYPNFPKARNRLENETFQVMFYGQFLKLEVLL